MSLTIVAVTLAIHTGSHAVLGTDRKTVYFDNFPTTGDIKAAIEDDAKFSELLASVEVEDVAAYSDDFKEAEGFISFECHDNTGHIGSVVIEEHALNTSSLVVI
jgi:hypothetical protein